MCRIQYIVDQRDREVGGSGSSGEWGVAGDGDAILGRSISLVEE